MKLAIVATLVASGFLVIPGLEASARPFLSGGQEGHGIADPKTEYRLRTARADAQQEKMHDAADEIGRLSVEVADRVARGEQLGSADSKALDRIKRLAKRLRSDLGGGGEPALDEKPANMRDAADSLGSSGAEVARLFSRSSKWVVDAKVIRKAGEIMLLVDFLKPYVR
jgi:hypothetical protein